MAGSKDKESAPAPTAAPAAASSRQSSRKRSAATSSSSSPPEAPPTKEARNAPPERRAASSAATAKSRKQSASKQSSPKTIAAASTAISSTAPPTPGSADSPTPHDVKIDKSQRGLRHFSMMVCKKVEEKGTTTYNEVADELVKKVVADRRKQNPTAKFDEKNIRRRVYDALNVLMAMDIIAKDKKEITWKGLPLAQTSTTITTTSGRSTTTAGGSAVSQDVEWLEREREFRKQQVERKREALRELLVQQVCFRNLVQNNHRRAEAAATAAAAAATRGGDPSSSAAASASSSSASNQKEAAANAKDGSGSGSHVPPPADERIPLPFIVVNTHSSAVIQCEMSPDREEVMFDFSMPFEINDDNSILKRLGMHKTNMRVLQEMLPDDLLSYCQEHGLLDSILDDKEGSSSPDFTVPATARMPSPQESG